MVYLVPKQWEKRGFISINGTLGRYSLINKVKSPYLPTNLFARRCTRDCEISSIRRTPHETVRSAAARYSNPENFRHRPRRVLRMSLINPTLPFFSFTLRHSINKRRRRTRRRQVTWAAGGCAPLSISTLVPFPPARISAEKALRQWESNDRG